MDTTNKKLNELAQEIANRRKEPAALKLVTEDTALAMQAQKNIEIVKHQKKQIRYLVLFATLLTLLLGGYNYQSHSVKLENEKLVAAQAAANALMDQFEYVKVKSIETDLNACEGLFVYIDETVTCWRNAI